jgi:hypothetical protein
MTSGRAIDHVVLAVRDLDRTALSYQPAQWFGRRTTRHSTMCGSPHLLDPTDALDDEYLSAHCL